MVLVSGIMGREHGESSPALVCLATDKQSNYAFWMIASQTAAGAEAVPFTVCFLSCMSVTLDVEGHAY